ncbi:hypothetical protein [Pantoea sp. aB]|uniref:hypothetical protein n=1 Tax=Pantoea sp. aB TaxID=517433 RepID=UPI0001E09BAC|nr:hypothetical protein [Pantoea sp. aB]EFM18633.1 conserved hypothetical protein from phage origin [Pantoea sp. aB]
MPTVHIVVANNQHIEQLLPHVRQADIEEFESGWAMTPEQVLHYGIEKSSFCWAGIADGDVVAIFGVTPASILTGNGTPWLVASDRLQKYSRAFIRHSKPLLAGILETFPRLENYVDARNIAAKQWLHWMGFQLYDPVPAGPNGMLFHRFTMEKKSCADL